MKKTYKYLSFPFVVLFCFLICLFFLRFFVGAAGLGIFFISLLLSGIISIGIIIFYSVRVFVILFNLDKKNRESGDLVRYSRHNEILVLIPGLLISVGLGLSLYIFIKNAIK